jgi:hypothetical protein
LYKEAFPLLQEDLLQATSHGQTERGRVSRPLSNLVAAIVQVISTIRRTAKTSATKSEAVIADRRRRFSRKQTTVSYGATCRCVLRIAYIVALPSGAARRA